MAEKRLVVAMDHARAMGAVAGLEDPGLVIDRVIEAGADAIMTSFGTLKRYRERLVDRVPVYLRLDGGPSLVAERWLENTRWTLLHSVEEAQLLGAEGVCLMYFMGAPCELQTLEIVADVAGQCLESEYPVMVEALPCPSPNIPDPLDAGLMADACRIGFEHGADLLKTYYPGTAEGFAQVVRGTPAPVLIAGGPRLPHERAVLGMVADSIAAGGAGVVFGRNIWQSADPAAMVRALRAVIHEGARADEAHAMLGA
jgi:DhnA family fructose-bisphosphate aldolase class Ia